MITIQLGQKTWEYKDFNEGEFAQMIRRMIKAGEAICVRIRIVSEDIEIALAAGNCSGGGSGGRQPNTREEAVFKEWEKLGLNSWNNEPGKIIVFLKQIKEFA